MTRVIGDEGSMRVMSVSSASYIASREPTGLFKIERGETLTADPLYLGNAPDQDRARRLLDWWVRHDNDVEFALRQNGSSTKHLMNLMVKAAEQTQIAEPIHRPSREIVLSDGFTIASRDEASGMVELRNGRGSIWLSPEDIHDIEAVAKPRPRFPLFLVEPPSKWELAHTLPRMVGDA